MAIKDNTNGILNEADRLIKQKLELAALVVEGQAKKPGFCPVKTGTARRSITHVIAPSGRTVYVGSNIEYFPFIEIGTSKMAARFPLTRALRVSRDRIRKIFNAR